MPKLSIYFSQGDLEVIDELVRLRQRRTGRIVSRSQIIRDAFRLFEAAEWTADFVDDGPAVVLRVLRTAREAVNEAYAVQLRSIAASGRRRTRTKTPPTIKGQETLV